MLSGSAFAHNQDSRGQSMREMRAAHSDLSRREIRQLVRVERSEAIRSFQNPGDSTAIQRQSQQFNSRSTVLAPNLLSNRFDGQSIFVAENGKTRGVARGVELDLSSSKRGITLGDDLFSNKSLYTIEVGGAHKELSTGSLVSASEFVALKQVIDSGSQSLVVDASGKAIDGSFSLSTISDGSRDIHAKSLVVPVSVEASGDFGRRADFRINGDLTNFGSVIATSSIAGANRADISARDITNAAGASIETLSSVVSGPIDLSLTADRNFQNAGSIKSSGNLSIGAGSSLQNSGVVRAANDLNIAASTLTNQGSLVSDHGNINFSTALPSDVFVDNSGGIVSALKGDINFRSAGYSEIYNTTLSGGDWQSANMNLNGGEGRLDVNVDKLTGAVHAHAASAVVHAQTDVLNIQELCANGDPLISNTNTIVLGSQTASGAPLTVVSSANIVLDSATLSTDNSGGAAGNITLVAGAAFSVNPGNIVISGASATGGNINYQGTAPVITANSTGGQAGNITLAAFFVDPNTGQINLSGSTIEAQGKLGSSNGDVSVIASGGIALGSINTHGASLTGGSISISGTQPQVVGTLMIDDTSGAILSGGLTAGSTISGALTVGGSVDVGGALVVNTTSAIFNGSVSATDLVVNTAGKIDVDTSLTARSGDIRLASSAKADLHLNDLQGDSIALSTLGSIWVDGSWTTAGSGGGIVAVAGDTIITIQDSSLDTSAVGQSGDVTLVAGATFTQTAGTITITGAETYGGDIILTDQFLGINTSTAGIGSGGSISLIAYGTPSYITGRVHLGQNAIVNTAGAQSGNTNGDILIMAGKPNSDNVITLGAQTSTSSGLSGSGSVNLVTAQANFNIVIDKNDGGVSSGNFLPASPTLEPGNVSGRAGATVHTLGAPLVIRSGATIDLSGTTSTVGTASLFAASSVADAGSITADSIAVTAGGSISLGGNLSSPTINLTSQTSGNITQTGTISTPIGGTLNISLGSNLSTASLLSANSIGTLIGQGAGTITFNNGTTDLKLGAIGSTQNLNLTADATVQYLGGINTSGQVNIQTQKFSTIGTTLTALRISILPVNGGAALTVDGGSGSSLIATISSGPPGAPSIPTGVILGSFSGGDLTLAGIMNLSGDVEIDSGTNLISKNGSLFTGANNVTLSAQNWIQQGNGNIVGNELIFSGTGIINPDGDVVLLNNLVFHGRDLVIAAKDNVDLGAFNIDLSSSIGDGGGLTILAGYSLSGVGSGQIQTAAPFNVTNSLSSTGSVTGTGTITTSSTAANGAAGNISIAAAGTISLLGSIDASADTGVGGTVAIAAPEGITLGTITATSPQQSGSVFVRPSDALAFGVVTYKNGAVVGPGFIDFINGDATSSPINLGSIDSFNINLKNLQAPINISGSVSGHGVTIDTKGSLNFTTTNTLAATEFNGDGGFFIISTPAISTSDGGPLHILAKGSSRAGALVFNAPGNLTVSQTGDITIDVRNASGTGPLSDGQITLNAVGLLTIDASAALAGDEGTYHLSPTASDKTPGELIITGDLAGSEIIIETQSKSTFEIGADKLPKNGVMGSLNADRIEIKNTVGAITISASNSVTATDLKLQTTGKSKINLAKGVVLTAANSLTLLTESANIGKRNFNVDAAVVNLTSVSGSVNVTDVRNSDVELRTASAGKSFTFTTAKGLSITNGVTTTKGSIALTAGGNDINIQDPVVANSGGVSILNTDTVTGDILISGQVQAFGRDVTIAIGALKKPKTNISPPFFLTVNEAGGGKVRLGPGGLVVPAPASVNATKKSVYFNNQGAGIIYLGSGNIVTASSQ